MAESRGPRFASCTPARGSGWAPNPIRVPYGRQSPVSRRIGNSPRKPWTVCSVMVFFFSQSRPGAPRATSDPRFGFSTVDPPTSQRENFGKKESRESSPKIGDSKRGGFFPRARYRESGLGQRVVPRLFVRATRGREKATLWRLPDLAVNFQGLHTCARGRRGGQHAAAGTVRSGESERSSRERGGHPARCAVPGASEASAASRGAAPSSASAVSFSQSSDVAGRRATMASSSPEDVHVLLVDDDRTCRTLVAGMLKKCNYQGEPRESPRARRREEPRDVTAIGRRGFSTAVDPPRARARTAFRLTLPSPNASPNPSQSPRRAAARRRWPSWSAAPSSTSSSPTS